MKIGSVFSGAGMLDEGVRSVLGGEIAWHCEFDPAASKVLAHNHPGIANLGDITKVDWSQVEPVGVLAGGFPCQDLSLAGRGDGLLLSRRNRSGLWGQMHAAIAELQPRFAVIENVRGLLSARSDTSREVDTTGPKGGRKVGRTDRALGRVLADLADIGYDTAWHGVRASDIGAPHQRFRVFLLAYRDGAGLGEHRWPRAVHPQDDSTERASYVAPDASGERFRQHPRAAPGEEARSNASDEPAVDRGLRPSVNWGPYRPAIERWERLTRPAPSPLERAPRGGQRLSPRFTEWLMGWPEGWVTDVPGISRNDQLKICGNGVVPQQAAHALRVLLHHIEEHKEQAA